MKFSILTTAQLELDAAANYYRQQASDLDLDFVREAKKTFERSKANPLSYTKVSQNTRSASLRRFPYSVFYSCSDTEIIVLSIGHHRRKPVDWSKQHD